MAGRIHLALAGGQAGAPVGVSQKSPSSFLQTGHIVPGPGPEAAQLPLQEALPVPVGLQDQLRNWPLGRVRLRVSVSSG